MQREGKNNNTDDHNNKDKNALTTKSGNFQVQIYKIKTEYLQITIFIQST